MVAAPRWWLPPLLLRPGLQAVLLTPRLLGMVRGEHGGTPTLPLFQPLWVPSVPLTPAPLPPQTPAPLPTDVMVQLPFNALSDKWRVVPIRA